MCVSFSHNIDLHSWNLYNQRTVIHYFFKLELCQAKSFNIEDSMKSFRSYPWYSIQLYQSSGSKSADRYCGGNKQIFIILVCTIFLEFPDEVPMCYIILQRFNLCETFGHDPASKLATCSQVIESPKS